MGVMGHTMTISDWEISDSYSFFNPFTHNYSVIHLYVNGSGLFHNFSLFSSSSNMTHIYGMNLYILGILYFVFTILLVLSILVGLVGNTLVIYVLSRMSKSQPANDHSLDPVTNIFNINLAIADVSTIMCSLVVATMSDSWPFGEVMCYALWFSQYFTDFKSTVFIVIIAADRYFAICHPTSSREYRTPKLAFIVSIIAWFCSALITSPIMLYVENWATQNESICTILRMDSDGMPMVRGLMWFEIFMTVMQVVVPIWFILPFSHIVIKRVRACPTDRETAVRQSG